MTALGNDWLPATRVARSPASKGGNIGLDLGLNNAGRRYSSGWKAGHLAMGVWHPEKRISSKKEARIPTRQFPFQLRFAQENLEYAAEWRKSARSNSR